MKKPLLWIFFALAALLYIMCMFVFTQVEIRHFTWSCYASGGELVQFNRAPIFSQKKEEKNRVE